MKRYAQDQVEKDIEVEAYRWEATNRNESSFIMPVRLFRFAKYIFRKQIGSLELADMDQDKLWEEVIDDVRPFAATVDEVERFKSKFILIRINELNTPTK